jgi:hypothetical protein
VIWAASDGDNVDIYLASPVVSYAFKFTYNTYNPD